MSSSGEEVLGEAQQQQADATWLKILTAYVAVNEPIFNAGAAYSWQTQEWGKGRPSALVQTFVGPEAGGGWGFNIRYAPIESINNPFIPTPPTIIVHYPTVDLLAALTPGDLATAPVFNPFNLHQIVGYESDAGANPKALFGADTASNAGDARVRAKLLGCSIPATTFAVGCKPRDQFGNLMSESDAFFDMQKHTNGWPSGPKYQDHKFWFHSDLKDVAYLYVKDAYLRIVKETP